MNDFSTLLQQGNAWLYIPSAIVLGALHGLEPGHSKTMMAAFIIAIRGTLTQAVLLGLSATLSHTAVVWVVAIAGLYFGQNWDAKTSEPYFEVASAIMIIGVAIWMLWRTWRNENIAHDHDHEHDHDEAKVIDTGCGLVRLEIFEEGTPPRFRIYSENAQTAATNIDQIKVLVERQSGLRETYTFVQREGFIESEQAIPEPHEFIARMSIERDGHVNDFDVEFVEHGHHHAIEGYEGLDVTAAGYQDPHELAHANDIRRRFANRDVTTGQIIVFGLTGGLIPCPASITVLLLCMQLKKIALGAVLVLSFSVGLALTMVTSGAIAALSVKHASKHWDGFGGFARKAPYVSGALITLVGIYVGYKGLNQLGLL